MWAEVDRLNWGATGSTKAGLQRKVLRNESLSSELRVVHFSTAETAIEGRTDTSVGDPELRAVHFSTAETTATEGRTNASVGDPRKQPKLKPYRPQTAVSTSCRGDATLRSYSLIKKIDI